MNTNLKKKKLKIWHWMRVFILDTGKVTVNK